ncbi:hypothetical protein BDZ94DRAFT_1272898 [Collybia nuda]|uniref:Uncharacterized protein n=1 Tax=Collybia nuda TaxID=64659 RepID=A0A9P5XV29_9AGAR|nr:hypothetical protein BDZ94DRAFT_1272898 [Collybia nuda]
MNDFPCLTDLEFRACTFPSFREFTDIICALQPLRHLTLSDVEWLEIDLPPPKEHKPPPRLKTLELYIARISHVLNWLMFDRTMLSIETVRLGSVFWEKEDTTSIGLFLRRLGPRLQHLTLPGHISDVDLSYNVKLQSLFVSRLGCVTSPDQVNGELWSTAISDGIQTTLSQLNSEQIAAISFKILHNTDMSPRLIFDWDGIGRILAKPCFSRLRMITVGVPSLDGKLGSLMKKIWGYRLGGKGCQKHGKSQRRATDWTV